MVNITAKWEAIFCCFLTFGLIINKIAPKKTGINAVGDGVIENMYPQNPKTINIIELIKLAVDGFIK